MFAHVLKGPKREMPEETGVFLPTPCPNCIHLNRLHPNRCAAFPEGIPMIFVVGGDQHTSAFKNDTFDDHGVTFSPILAPH